MLEYLQLNIYFILFLSIFPGLFICYLIYRQDKYEAEPKSYLLICFLFGVFSTYPALKMEEFGLRDLRLSISEHMGMTFTFAFLVIAFSEELVKFMFLRYLIYPLKHFSEPLDGIVYSVMISMGFATMENVLYIVSSNSSFTLAILRMFTAVPAHAAFAVTMGYFVGTAKFNKKLTNVFPILGLVLAIFLHGLYDFFLFQKYSPKLAVFTFVTLGISIILGLFFTYRHTKLSQETHNSNLV